MKRSRASERKHTQQSLIFHLLFLCSLVICSCTDGKPDYDFKDSHDAISRYSDFQKCVHALPECSTDQLVDFVNNWRELSDTVYNYIRRDASFSAHADLKTDFFMLSDTIRQELLRLAISQPRSMKDVATLKMRTSPYTDNTEMKAMRKSAEAFFLQLDKQTTYKTGSAKELRNQYANFLSGMRSQQITDSAQLCRFIEIEDRHFRTFLVHLPEYSDMGMTDITKTTEAICSQVFQSASVGTLPSDLTLVYMSMRTNRRLVQNAIMCQQLLKAQKVKSSIQVNAYLWMIVQPYLSIDSFAITMLSEKQQKDFMAIAEGYPTLIDQLSAKGLVDKQVALQLPSQLIRLYVSSL